MPWLRCMLRRYIQPENKYHTMLIKYICKKKWIVHIVSKECIRTMYDDMSWTKMPGAPFAKWIYFYPSMDK